MTSLDPRDFLELKEQVEEAERKLSHMAEVGEGIDAASLNELRYGFVHLLRALVDDSSEELSRAKKHVQRAIYDSYEIEVYYCLNIFREFAEHWHTRPVVISEVQPKWPEWCQVMDELKAFRGTVPRDNRDAYVKSLDKKLTEPRAIVAGLQYWGEELKKKALHQEQTQFWIKFGSVAAALAVVSTVVVGGVVYYLQKMDAKAAVSVQKADESPRSEPK